MLSIDQPSLFGFLCTSKSLLTFLLCLEIEKESQFVVCWVESTHAWVVRPDPSSSVLSSKHSLNKCPLILVSSFFDVKFEEVLSHYASQCVARAWGTDVTLSFFLKSTQTTKKQSCRMSIFYTDENFKKKKKLHRYWWHFVALPTNEQDFWILQIWCA